MEKLDIENYIYGGQGITPPAKGGLLLAQPLMADPIFSRAAILLLEGNKEAGYIGLVLNDRSRWTMDDIIKGCPDGNRFPIYIGGPVDLERLFMIHTLGAQIPGSIKVAEGIYTGGNLGDIVAYLKSPEADPEKIRFFLGYSGWSAGQLETEMMERTWVVLPQVLSADLLTGDGNEYWRREVARLGDEYRNWLAVPELPGLN